MKYSVLILALALAVTAVLFQNCGQQGGGPLSLTSNSYGTNIGNPGPQDGQPAMASPSPTPAPSLYASKVMGDGASIYYRLDEATTPTQTKDAIGTNNASVTGTSAFGAAGATTDGDTAANLTNANITAQTAVTSTPSYSEEIWFKTGTHQGGVLIAFWNQSANEEGRNLYMLSSGQIAMALNPTGTAVTIESPSAYNDNVYHHAVATYSTANGMHLYVDGALVVSHASLGALTSYSGNWHVGYADLTGWPVQPASWAFSGIVDEAAIYPLELTAAQVQVHYNSR